MHKRKLVETFSLIGAFEGGCGRNVGDGLPKELCDAGGREGSGSGAMSRKRFGSLRFILRGLLSDRKESFSSTMGESLGEADGWILV
jgi:hypothetical protein